MELGTLLPLGDIGGDPAAVREYAQTAEAIGHDFVEAPDRARRQRVSAASRAAPEPGCTRTRLCCSGIAGCTQSSASRPAC